MPTTPIRRALIAVYDKTGIVDFARSLVDEFGIEIISTGGTAKHLKDAGIPVTMVETVTGFPEMLDGRVKTLHPKIHAGILANRDNPEHMRQLAEHGIQPIDMVVVNLYPFEKTIADPNCKFADAIEMIDIGGPCLLRAAAKNHKHVLVLHDRRWFPSTLSFLREPHAYNAEAQRQWMADQAAQAFWRVSKYDSTVASWFGTRQELGEYALERRGLHLEGQAEDLRYGENPNQKAQVFGFDAVVSRLLCTPASAGNPPLSYNNIVDADASLGLCAELTRARMALWHRFPTGDLGHRFSTGGTASPRHVAPRIRDELHSVRNLPHIQKPGATYFLTFRTRLGELSPSERDIALSACRFWHEKKMTVHAVTVMPDHVHLLLTPHKIDRTEWVSLGELMQSIKRHSAYEINRLRGAQGSVWLDENFDRVIRDEREFVEKFNYIVANPVTAGLCKNEREYAWTWTTNTGFMETLESNDRLETGDTEHRLETGATAQAATPAIEPMTPPRVAVFIKHTNACGVGIGGEAVEAYRTAYMGDPIAAMGGVLAVNFSVNAEFATTVMETYDRFGRAAGAGGFFVEVWVAPSFHEDAIEIIRTKKKWGENVRLLSVGDMSEEPDAKALEYKTIAGGMLVQTPDLPGLNEEQWKVVTKRAPTESEISDLRLAWLIAKHTKSNAISICKDGMLIGNGAGQMSRVMSCRIATWLAKENGHADKLAGAVAASDAFFPFRDGPGILIDTGITALIQPGGSKRDDETISLCDERGVAMIFTGTRHFKH